MFGNYYYYYYYYFHKQSKGNKEEGVQTKAHTKALIFLYTESQQEKREQHSQHLKKKLITVKNYEVKCMMKST